MYKKGHTKNIAVEIPQSLNNLKVFKKSSQWMERGYKS